MERTKAQPSLFWTGGRSCKQRAPYFGNLGRYKNPWMKHPRSKLNAHFYRSEMGTPQPIYEHGNEFTVCIFLPDQNSWKNSTGRTSSVLIYKSSRSPLARSSFKSESSRRRMHPNEDNCSRQPHKILGRGITSSIRKEEIRQPAFHCRAGVIEKGPGK